MLYASVARELARVPLSKMLEPIHDPNQLIDRIDNIHTTELGAVRISRNIGIDRESVVNWCKQVLVRANRIVRKGKNWYVYGDNAVITINSHSHTIITAHLDKS